MNFQFELQTSPVKRGFCWKSSRHMCVYCNAYEIEIFLLITAISKDWKTMKKTLNNVKNRALRLSFWFFKNLNTIVFCKFSSVLASKWVLSCFFCDYFRSKQTDDGSKFRQLGSSMKTLELLTKLMSLDVLWVLYQHVHKSI